MVLGTLLASLTAGEAEVLAVEVAVGLVVLVAGEVVVALAVPAVPAIALCAAPRLTTGVCSDTPGGY